MFNRPGTTVFMATTLHFPKTRSVIHKDGEGEPLGVGASATKKSSFVKEANRARDTIATALASIKNLPARDDREGVSSSYRDEYTQSIRTLDRIIRREWNYAITTYLSAPESSRSSSRDIAGVQFFSGERTFSVLGSHSLAFSQSFALASSQVKFV